MKKKIYVTLTVLTALICTACRKNPAITPVPIDQAQVGDYVVFGAYEQDNNASNGKEDIEWLVLDKNGDKLFVISRYVLDCQRYNSVCQDVTWDTSPLRTWLNGNFVSEAFSSEEQKRIVSTTVTTDKNPVWNTYPGDDTTDQVFLLSLAEADLFFDSDIERRCLPTAYAQARGVVPDEQYNGNSWWWLRSPGKSQSSVVYVGSGGDFDVDGYDVDAGDGVRPAMWIDPNL